VKTTIELPDSLLREAKAAAAREGKSLKDVFTAALRDHLGPPGHTPRGKEAWRSVFGKAKPRDVKAVDDAVSEDLERTVLETWR